MIRSTVWAARLLLLVTCAPAGVLAQSALVLDGRLTSESGGFKFPDGTIQTTAHVAGSPYARTLVVAKVGTGDFLSVQDALDSITDASASKRYLVYVAPGTYTEVVTMKEWVDIEGAGELKTTIRQVAGSANPDTGTVICADNAELRFLTVEMAVSVNQDYAIAIFCDSTSPRLTHVTARSTGGGLATTGIYNLSASPVMTDVRVTADDSLNSRGVYNEDSSPTMVRVTIEAGPSLVTSTGIYNTSSSAPEITGGSVTADGGTGLVESFGIRILSSTATITDVVVTARNGSTCSGVYTASSSVATIVRTIVDSTEGCAISYGIDNNGGAGSVTVNVHQSKIISGDETVHHFGGATTNVAMSQLAGAAVISLSVNCVGVYDENYVVYPTVCP